MPARPSDCRYRPVLDADEPDDEVVEFLQRYQEVARAAGEAIKFPNRNAVDLAVPRRRHQRI
jgi:hypothetical protein